MDFREYFEKMDQERIRKYRELNAVAVKGQTVCAGSSLMENFPINELLEPAVSRAIFTFNPLALILYEARNALLYAVPCQWELIGVWTVVAALLAVWGVSVVYKAESRYIKVL